MSQINKEKTVAYIEEQARLYEGTPDEKVRLSVLDACIDIVSNMPEIAEAYPIPVIGSEIKNNVKVMCSNCRYEYIYQNWMEYCPKCGFKFR